MIRCIAIDDEPKALDILENHISRVDFLQLEGKFVDPFKAVTFANDHNIELVFLDINMPGVSGLELMKNFTGNPQVIFTTAHSEYAIESYDVEALDYLLKPFDFARFFRAATRAKDKLAGEQISEAGFFFINTGNQKQKLFFDDIYFIEGEGNYVGYNTRDKKWLVRSTIRETLNQLPSDKFVQIHRSFIVALKWIEKIEDNHVYIVDKKISISSTYREQFFRLIERL